jgi:hypothetical protein
MKVMTLTVAAAAIALCATDAAAQQLTRNPVRASIVRESLPPDPSYVRSVMTKAQDETIAGRPVEARRLYEQLIAEQKKAGQYNGKALWQLALNYLYADEVRKAATTLDALTEEADRYGDPAMEMRASFEAGALWHQLKRDDLALPRIEAAQMLLQSPVISDSDKRYITQRLEPAEATK